MKEIYIIDVMPLLYRGHFAFFRKPRMTTTGINTSAIFSYVMTVLQIMQSRKPSHIALVFDSRTPTFRHETYPEYKAQRDKLPEDIAAAIDMAKDFADAMNIPALRVDGYEADDLMGTIARIATEGEEMRAYLVSPDKDIAQLVNEHTFLYRLGNGEPEVWDEAKVRDHWGLASPAQMIDYLALAGDASDNIPGVKGIGEKTAQKLLAEHHSIEGIIAAANEGKLGDKVRDKVITDTENARLSRFLTTIRTDVPVDIKIEDLQTKEPNREALTEFLAKYELGNVARKFEIDISAAKQKISKQNDEVVTDKPLETIETTPHEYTLVKDEATLQSLLRALDQATIFSIDTEATGTDPREATLVGISIATAPHRAWYIPYNEKAEPRKEQSASDDLFSLFDNEEPKPQQNAPDGELFSLFADNEPQPPAASDAPAAPTPDTLPAETIRRALAPYLASAKEKVAHNSKYDRELLARYSLPVSAPCHDTMLMHFTLNSVEHHNLDRLSKIYLGYAPIPISKYIGEGKQADPELIAQIPPQELCPYAAEDADITLRLYLALLPITKEAGVEDAILKSEEPLVQVLLDMESAGVKLDTDAIRLAGRELQSEISSHELRIFAEAGDTFNLHSPRQLGEILFDKLRIDEKAAKTATGQYTTSEDVLQKYASKHEIVRNILAWRTAEKLKTTYIDKLPTFIDPKDGRIHSHFSQAFTETGRLASSDPNLQNIPVRTEQGKKVRAAFVAKDQDHILLSADYSQIELRIMAALSQDEAMLSAIRTGADIHAQTASRVYKVPIEEVTPEQRSRCKMVNFGIIYGISVFGLSQRLGIARQEASELIDEYFRQYPGIQAFMTKIIEEAREKGYATTILGRRRELRDINSRNANLRQAAERNAINTPVQGSAADLIKLAMVRVATALKEQGLRSRLILQIHDELLLDVVKEEEAQVRTLVRDAMQNAYDFGIPLEVEIGTGNTWLEAH